MICDVCSRTFHSLSCNGLVKPRPAMAQKIWTEILEGKLSASSVVAWLQPGAQSDLAFGCNPEEFVDYFSSELRSISIGVRAPPAPLNAVPKNDNQGNLARDVQSVAPLSARNTTDHRTDFQRKNTNLSSEHNRNWSRNTHQPIAESGGFRGRNSPCVNSNLGDFITRDYRQRKEKNGRSKNVNPRRINPTRLTLAGSGSPSSSHSGTNDNLSSREDNWEVPEAILALGQDNSGQNDNSAALKWRPEPIQPPWKESWEIPESAAEQDNVKTNRAHIPPDKENWNVQAVPMVHSLDVDINAYNRSVIQPFVMPPFKENWDLPGPESEPNRFGVGGTHRPLGSVPIGVSLPTRQRRNSQKLAAEVPAVTGLPDSLVNDADLTQVTQKDILDSLSTIYCFLLDSSTFLSLVAEMGFVISLLCIKGTPCAKTSTPSILHSVHNCMYFATSILNNEHRLFAMFSVDSLKLLADNVTIYRFNSELSAHFGRVYTQAKTILEHPKRDGSGANVNFVCETDNRVKFPNETAFYSFKKQRDLFYECLENWERGHNSPNWSFQQSLGSKVKLVVTAGNEDPSNFLHFCRLFRGQLLGNCSGTLESDNDELGADVLECFNLPKPQEPNKYARMRERTTRPGTVSSTRLQEFPGHQEFFMEFILVANNAKLNFHLIDSFSSEIARIVTSCIPILCVENYADAGKETVDDTTSLVYTTQIAALRLLAKFLGFVSFLPYHSQASLTHDLAESQAAARAHTQPPVDVCAALNEAMARNQLVLVVPWVTKYLSMADPVSMSLPYYIDVANTLFQLHASVDRDVADVRCPSTTLLVQLSIGWLLEKPSFPGRKYLSWFFSAERRPPPPLQTVGGLDSVPLAARPSALHAACPALRRLDVAVASGGARSAGCAVTATVALRRNKTPDETLQTQLEETFFNMQVPALRQTVLFVSEQIASGCITHMSNTVLSEFKAETLAKNQGAVPKHLQSQISKTYAAECEARWLDHVSAACSVRSEAAIEALLSQDLEPAIRKVAAEIATRIARQKALEWLEGNILAGTYEEEMSSELERQFRKATNLKGNRSKKRKGVVKTSHTIEPGARNVTHDDSACPPASAMVWLRKLLFTLRKGKPVEGNELLRVKAAVESVFAQREDLVPSGEGIIHTLYLELLFFVAVLQPDSLAVALEAAQELWKLPEMQPKARDAVQLLRLLKFHVMSVGTLSEIGIQAFTCLLQAVVKMDCKAPLKMREQLYSIQPGESSVSLVIILRVLKTILQIP